MGYSQISRRDLVLLLTQDPRHWVDMTHHCLLSPDSSQSPLCDQAITPSSSLAAQMELLGKAGLRVNCCKSRANTQKKWFGRVNGSKSRTNTQKKQFGKAKSRRKHHELNWSELMRLGRLPIFAVAIYMGASVLVFLLLCVKDLSIGNMWTTMFFFWSEEDLSEIQCCGDLRIFCTFRTISPDAFQEGMSSMSSSKKTS